MLVRSGQKQDCPLYNCLNGTTYNIQNISALTANQGTNTLAFSYAELTLINCRKGHQQKINPESFCLNFRGSLNFSCSCYLSKKRFGSIYTSWILYNRIGSFDGFSSHIKRLILRIKNAVHEANRKS